MSQQDLTKALTANPSVDGILNQYGTYGALQALLNLDRPLIAMSGQGENGWRQVAAGVGGGMAVAGGIPVAGAALGLGMGVGGAAGAVANQHARDTDPTGRGRDATDEAMAYADEQGYTPGSIWGGLAAGAAAIGTTAASLVEGGVDWARGTGPSIGNRGEDAVRVHEDPRRRR